ncbi:MAG: hypothetical protein H0U29_01590, partial [Acidimicrobiia bacterium]|nr:hypothetical protein [Acidimicrobiia bacterium]
TGPGGVHRLRDLDSRSRLLAAVLALALLVVPLVAAAVNHGRWIPQGDDALIELRARDVGTARTPLVGQPSTSGNYGEGGDNVAHPGPAEFFLMAPGVRILGPVTGAFLTTALVGAASLLTVAWVLFRRLGPWGGALGVALGALVAFSSGAGGLVDPLSSNAGRLPLLATAVLVWALLGGDLRLAPLAVLAWSYAAQQHLSVLPATAVLAVAGLAGAAWWVVRGDPDGLLSRRKQLTLLAGAVGVGVVVWAPVLVQQLTGDPGNLSALAGYSGDSERKDLGLRSAIDQVSHVLGFPPFIGQTNPSGWDLLERRSATLVSLTLGVVAVVLAAGAWWRRAERGLVAAVVMIGVLAVAGLVTGTNVPDSLEQSRINFFHWAFVLSFFELLVLVWLVARVAAHVSPRLTQARPIAGVVAAIVVVVAVAAAPLVIDRSNDRLPQAVATPALTELHETLRSSDVLARARGPLVVMVNGVDGFVQVGDTVGVRLIADGYDVRFPPGSRGGVHPDRLLEPCRAANVLVVSLMLSDVVEPPGRELARVDSAPDLDRAALERMVRAAEGVDVELGPTFEAALEALPGNQGQNIGLSLDFRLGQIPERLLLNRLNLDLLIANPIQSPRFDPADLEAVRDGLPPGASNLVAEQITVHLLTPEELGVWQPDLACP